MWKGKQRLDRKCLKASSRIEFLIYHCSWRRVLDGPSLIYGLGKLPQVGQNVCQKCIGGNHAGVDSLAGVFQEVQLRGLLGGALRSCFTVPGKPYHWGEVHAGSSKELMLSLNRWRPPCLPGGHRGYTAVTKRTKSHLFLGPVCASVTTELQAGAGSLCGLRVKGKTFRFSLSIFFLNPTLYPHEALEIQETANADFFSTKNKNALFLISEYVFFVVKFRKISEMHKEGNLCIFTNTWLFPSALFYF